MKIGIEPGDSFIFDFLEVGVGLLFIKILIHAMIIFHACWKILNFKGRDGTFHEYRIDS